MKKKQQQKKMRGANCTRAPATGRKWLLCTFWLGNQTRQDGQVLQRRVKISKEAGMHAFTAARRPSACLWAVPCKS